MKEVGGKSLRKGKTLQFIKLDFATILENYMFIFTFPRNYLFLFVIEEVGQKFLIKNFNHMFNKMNYKKTTRFTDNYTGAFEIFAGHCTEFI